MYDGTPVPTMLFALLLTMVGIIAVLPGAVHTWLLHLVTHPL